MNARGCVPDTEVVDLKRITISRKWRPASRFLQQLVDLFIFDAKLGRGGSHFLYHLPSIVREKKKKNGGGGAIGHRDGREREMRKFGTRENVILHMSASHSFHAMWEIILGSDHLEECLDRTFLERVRPVRFNCMYGVWSISAPFLTFVTKAVAERVRGRL